MSATYLPSSDADRTVWLNNFSNRLVQYQQALGLTTAEVNRFEADANMFAYIVQLNNALNQYTLAVSSTRRSLRSSSRQIQLNPLPAMPNIGNAPAAVPSGIFNRVAMLVSHIRQHEAYTTAMGQDLGIIAPVVPFNPATMQPELTVQMESGFPKLKWIKGDADAIKIYVDRHDNAGFVLVKQTVKNSFLDTEPLPPNIYSVTWDYKARYLIEDDEVGLFSQVLSINVVRG